MLASLKKRVQKLESEPQQQVFIPLNVRIAEYVAILDSGDYSSEKGRSLKYCMDKYCDVLKEIESEE